MSHFGPQPRPTLVVYEANVTLWGQTEHSSKTPDGRYKIEKNTGCQRARKVLQTLIKASVDLNRKTPSCNNTNLIS